MHNPRAHNHSPSTDTATDTHGHTTDTTGGHPRTPNTKAQVNPRTRLRTLRTAPTDTNPPLLRRGVGSRVHLERS